VRRQGGGKPDVFDIQGRQGQVDHTIYRRPQAAECSCGSWGLGCLLSAVETSARLGRDCVIYLDAGLEVRSRLDHLNANLKLHGYWFVGASRGGGHENHGSEEKTMMLYRVHPGQYLALGLLPDLYAERPTLAAGMLGICHNSSVWGDVFIPWWRCALRPECIAPVGSNKVRCLLWLGRPQRAVAVLCALSVRRVRRWCVGCAPPVCSLGSLLGASERVPATRVPCCNVPATWHPACSMAGERQRSPAARRRPPPPACAYIL